MSTPTYVYRCYGPDDALLYVGIANDVEQRLANHAQKEWWRMLRHVETEELPNRIAAKRLETKYIRELSPRFNIAETSRAARAKPPEVDYKNRKWISIKQAAEQIGVNAYTIRKMIDRGEINAYRFSERVIRIDAVELELAGRLEPNILLT